MATAGANCAGAHCRRAAGLLGPPLAAPDASGSGASTPYAPQRAAALLAQRRPLPSQSTALLTFASQPTVYWRFLGSGEAGARAVHVGMIAAVPRDLSARQSPAAPRTSQLDFFSMAELAPLAPLQDRRSKRTTTTARPSAYLGLPLRHALPTRTTASPPEDIGIAGPAERSP